MCRKIMKTEQYCMQWKTAKIMDFNIPLKRTGHVYSEAVMTTALEEFNVPFSFMTYEWAPLLETATHKIQNLRIENGGLYMDYCPMNTPIMEAFSSSEFNFFPVGTGKIIDGNKITEYKLHYIRSELSHD